MTFLLVIIYVSFISLGLPDSLLGSAWPSVYGDIGASISNAGIISMIIAGGTIISSLLSDKLICKLGTGKVTFISVAMTAAALIGLSCSNSFILFCIWAVPLGLGAGSVDAALNNFVALHYKAQHMSWLHCFWGIGASAGPVVMAFSLSSYSSWSLGYRIVGFIQIALVAVLFVTLPLWRKGDSKISQQASTSKKPLKLSQIVKLNGAKQILLVFFCYCAIETTVGLWGSSYLVMSHGISAETAASWISLYYFGITLGRFLSGFLSMKLTKRQIVRAGQIVICIGIILMLIPFTQYALLASLFLIGLGCAPIYPNLLHQTPENFGEEKSQSIMGVQMACAYIGTTFVPPIFGVVANWVNYDIFPFFILVLLLLMALMTIILYKTIDKSKNKT